MASGWSWGAHGWDYQSFDPAQPGLPGPWPQDLFLYVELGP